ncbi:hypothetical protein [Streptomyces sp. NPDC007264]|uniref:hypothetical protein n=1 Tax=Streptomyces sp. NPDC007264 TaxID=3364777 RepID=UPI0036DBBB44
MLNRIRRAISRARARHAPKGRHRRHLTPSRPPAVPGSSAPVDQPTVALGMALDRTSHRYFLRGEDTALVRPYLLAWEETVRRHPMDAVIAGEPARARSVLAGVG